MSKKKNLWKMLTLTLVLGLFLAAQASAQTKFGPKTAPFLKMFTSGGTYHMKATMSSGGVKSNMEVFVKGDKMAMLMSSEGVNTRIISNDKKTYIIDDSRKMIMVTALQETSNTRAVDADELTFVGSGTASFNGKNLPYEEYKDKDGNKTQFFVDGDKLAGTRNIIPGEGTIDSVILVLDKNVPDSVFNIPTSGYTIQDMSRF